MNVKRFMRTAVLDRLTTISSTSTSSTSESVGLITETAKENSNNIISLSGLHSNHDENPLHNRFVSVWKKAIKGNFDEFNSVVDAKAKWDNPFVSTASEYIEGLQKLNSFAKDIELNIFNIKPSSSNSLSFEIEYQLSFTYPMPWEPRFIIPAKAYIELSPTSTITKVIEKWDFSVIEIFTKQFFPRLWDIFHLFNTPCPEYPPHKVLGKIDGVEFIEISPTLNLEVRWQAPANQAGPPLQAIPDFALFGPLSTSKMNKEVFYTVMPPEVKSGRYICPETGRTMKQSSWVFHVPTILREKVLKQQPLNEYISLTIAQGEVSDDDESVATEMDYVVGYELFNVMKSLTKGTLRGDFELNTTLIEDMRRNEKADYAYQYSPKRIIARTDISGMADSEKISKAFQLLKKACANTDSVRNVLKTNKPFSLSFPPSQPSSNQNPWLGLQLFSNKVCFNSQAQPAMSIYEIQFQSKLTKVYVELELQESN